MQDAGYGEGSKSRGGGHKLVGSRTRMLDRVASSRRRVAPPNKVCVCFEVLSVLADRLLVVCVCMCVSVID